MMIDELYFTYFPMTGTPLALVSLVTSPTSLGEQVVGSVGLTLTVRCALVNVVVATPWLSWSTLGTWTLQ